MENKYHYLLQKRHKRHKEKEEEYLIQDESRVIQKERDVKKVNHKKYEE